MRSSTIIGIILGFLAILGSFLWEGGSMSILFLLPAITIVIGGTLAAGIIGSSFSMMAKIPQLFILTVTHKEYDWETILDSIIKIATQTRKLGLLSIEESVNKIEHPFLKKMLTILIDGIDKETLVNVAEFELQSISQRHKENISLLTKLGGYSPTMGIIGTVMGLIGTFTSTGGDPNQLIHHIASAFIATLWGIFMANIVWLPLADKLKVIDEQEIRLNHFIVNGILSIQAGDTPSITMMKLAAAFPASKQENILKRLKRIREQENEEIASQQQSEVLAYNGSK
ncbi:MAG TPA: MotA/TolQ/ExbB proton channel family protein [Candidatus Kapabacteria bacterium]|nr:MotA/TolQ/ExbB proton channel family protein [Candidatus Kapabacteria bacterium]